jgi:hypothetical protein
MQCYHGRRTDGGVLVTVNGVSLDPRRDLYDHSPDGFEWGYGGSGPAQLALAILADYLGNDNEALALYQSFKWSVVVKLPKRGWTISSRDINHALDELRTQNLVTGGAS